MLRRFENALEQEPEESEKKDSATNLAEKGRIYPFVEREGLFGRIYANSAFVVLIWETIDVNLGDFPLVGDKSILSDLGGAMRTVNAQGFNCFVNANYNSRVQETLKNSDSSSTDVERVGVCDGVHWILGGCSNCK